MFLMNALSGRLQHRQDEEGPPFEDLLPDAMAETISALVEEGSVVMKKLWNQGQLRLVLV